MLALFLAPTASAIKRAPVIKGVVVNTTCPGPCRVPPPPPPLYTGPGLTVKVRDLRTGALVATLHPTDGHFEASVTQLRRYHVHAGVEGSCWRGSGRDVRVGYRDVKLRLSVHNACIV